jgi:spermidine synthase
VVAARSGPLATLLYLIFFLSGVGALLFETLWFRQAGLVFGNGVWASSLVLAGFMSGLALGNALSARIGPRLRSPLASYAWLEFAIAVSGVALVIGLPLLTVAITPILRPLLDQPWLANPVRLFSGFALLMIPSTAMGATLPLLVQALVRREGDFAAALGKLYGWNTLGAMVGALVAELFLIEALGIRGASYVAAGCSCVAGFGTLALRHRFGEVVAHTPEDHRPSQTLAAGAWRWLFVAFSAGLLMLALEVVWFRFLLLFMNGSSVVFSSMLAVVLGGIALGGLAGGSLWRRFEVPGAAPAWITLAAGLLVAGTYMAYEWAPFDSRFTMAPITYTLLLSIPLMAPIAICSGLLFVTVGALLEREMGVAVRATGLLNLANTVGSGLGSLIGGFVLLPYLGIELSFFILALGYGLVALFVMPGPKETGKGWALQLALPAAALLLLLALYPHGLMRSHYLGISTAPIARQSKTKIVAVREGRSETIVLMRRDDYGQLLEHRLVTNGFSMTASDMRAMRYMNLYAWWPRIFVPEQKTALLISYGLGNTAAALVETPGLERIDVVDISREILELADVVFADPEDNPLNDPRVNVYIEDGRHFLQVTDRRYDVITGEPPPPKYAGVVNLYTREYFQLVHDRLTPGGMHTYWLPVHSLTVSDTRAIMAAYCDVFEDCSLWTGAGFDWMLVGTRAAGDEGSASPDFNGLFEDPRARAELAAVGLERPEQLGALFMADSDQLQHWIDHAPPLTDNFPKRLENEVPLIADLMPTYLGWMETKETRARFVASSWIADTWPSELREATLPYFRWQEDWNGWGNGMLKRLNSYGQTKLVHQLLTETPLKILPLVYLGTTPKSLSLATNAGEQWASDSRVAANLGVGAMVDGRYDEAAIVFAELQASNPQNPAWIRYRLLALCIGGQRDQAAALIADLPDASRVGSPSYWTWYEEMYGLTSPLGAQ